MKIFAEFSIKLKNLRNVANVTQFFRNLPEFSRPGHTLQ